MPYERSSSFGECYRRDLLVQLRRKAHLADPRRRQGNPAGEIDKCRGSRITRHAGTRQSVRGGIRDPFRSKGNVGASSDSPSQFHAWQRELNSGWNLVGRASTRRDSDIRAEVRNRQARYDNGASAVTIGSDFQCAAQLAKSFPQPTDSHAGRACRQELNFFVRRYTLALILDFDSNLAIRASNADRSDRALRMTMDVREALLDQAKNRRL